MQHDCKGSEPESTDIAVHGSKGYLAIVDTAADTISVIDGIGNVRRFINVISNVAVSGAKARELREAAAAMQSAIAEAAIANRAKSEFLAVMSHELRTPLTSSSGFIDLLSRTDNLTSKQRRYIELVGTANGALLAVIDDILDFSKIETGQLKLERRAFSLPALLRDTLAIVLPAATAKSLRLECTIQVAMPEWLLGDHARLRQILLNLLNNAVKFTGSGSIVVDVRRQPPSGDRERIRFSVADTGIGIPAADHQRVFERFSQADSSLSRRHGGIGLGLSICKKLVSLMNGEIGVISDGDRGSTVWFTALLTLVTEPKPASVVISPPRNAAKRGARILVVDDVDLNLEIVEAYLSQAGYSVDTALSAGEAIRMLVAECYDLVLMDIQMPEMDGLAATRCIRSLADWRKYIPIIAMTGNVLPDQVQGFLEAGMDGHISKPIELAALCDNVKRWLPMADADDIDVPPNSQSFPRLRSPRLQPAARPNE